MSEENVENSIANILSILGDNSNEKEMVSGIVENIIENACFEIKDPDNACLHYNVYFGKITNAIKEAYAENVVDKHNIDISELSDRNKYLFKKLYTSWSKIERTIGRYIEQLNGTAMLSTDYARDVVRNYKKALLNNVDFSEFCDMTKIDCKLPEAIDEYPEDRAWYQPPVGSKLDWLRFAYAIETNDIMLQIDSCAKIVLERKRGDDY